MRENGFCTEENLVGSLTDSTKVSRPKVHATSSLRIHKGRGRQESGLDILGNLREVCLQPHQESHQVIDKIHAQLSRWNAGIGFASPPLRRLTILVRLVLLCENKDLYTPSDLVIWHAFGCQDSLPSHIACHWPLGYFTSLMLFPTLRNESVKFSCFKMSPKGQGSKETLPQWALR